MSSDVEVAVEKIFRLSDGVRYVAVYRAGVLASKQRWAVEAASSEQSDRYEELFVNPGILTLARQRGNVDCGGLRFVVIGYGHFFQFIMELSGGHLSVCFELSEDPLRYSDRLLEIAGTLV